MGSSLNNSEMHSTTFNSFLSQLLVCNAQYKGACVCGSWSRVGTTVRELELQRTLGAKHQMLWLCASVVQCRSLCWVLTVCLQQMGRNNDLSVGLKEQLC